MKQALFAVFGLLAAVALAGSADAAYLGWGCNVGAGITDSTGAYLTGTNVPGGPVDLAQGALVQLVKQVGDIDPYLVPSTTTSDPAGVELSDEVLQEVHVGYGAGPPGMAQTQGFWAVPSVDLPVIPGDVLYARAYNVPQSEVATTALDVLQVGIKNVDGQVPTYTFTQADVMNPPTIYFDNLRTEPIPEPASLLFLVPGLAVWALRRKK